MTSLLTKTPDKQGYGSIDDPNTNRSVFPGSSTSNATFLSRMLFSYATPKMQLGNEQQLNLNDLWVLEGDDEPAEVFRQYTKQFERHHQSVLAGLWYTYGGSLVPCGIATVFTVACSLFAPLVLHHVIDAFAAPNIDSYDLAIWLGAFFASRLASVVVAAQTSFHLQRIVLRLTVALKTLIFTKAMKRSIPSKSDATAVAIPNLYSSDVNNLLWAAFKLNNLWIMPIQIAVIVFMLYNVLGFAAFAGLGVIGLSMFASITVARVAGGLYKTLMAKKDERMNVVKEVFSAIQIVKLNAWEAKFSSKIATLRAVECSYIGRLMSWRAISGFVLWTSPLFVSIASFAVYSLVMGRVLTAAKVFTSMALFNAVRDPLRDFPNVIQTCIQAKVSLDRISTFLAMEEYEPRNVDRESSTESADVAIAVRNGAFGWSKDTPLLTNVNLEAKRGDFVVVHGAVGSGKSSLCSALLGEMDKIAGSVLVRGKVAYYSQQTWIQNLTIRDNILFGNAFDAHKYATVLDACGLVPDLASFPAGDATEIGEKGVNLSGGQKARVCLARACYADADVLILDSPLAAVDAVVQSEIFAKCICRLLESKTVVLVTHSRDIFASPPVNVKVVVDNGNVRGERRDVTQARSTFAPPLSPRQSSKVPAAHALGTEASNAIATDAGRLVLDEEREEGRVSTTVFMEYFRALGGVNVCVLLLLMQSLWQAFQISSDLWLSRWTSEPVHADDNAAYNMRVCACLGGAAALMVLTRSLLVAALGLRASRHLFDAMTTSLLHAPLRFFDANPIGRILNRFSEDMSAVDTMLPTAYGAFLAKLFATAFQLATAVYMVQFLGVLILPLVVLYVQFATFFLASSREMTRLWKIASSPVLSHVTQSEEGVAVIRAFGPAYVERMVNENVRRNATYNRVWFAETVMTQWFQTRMQLIGCGMVILVVSALVYLHAVLSPGLVGLAFTYVLSVDSGLSGLVVSWTYVEYEIVSPERIFEYVNLPAEGTDKMVAIEPLAQWPRRGAVTFEDVVFSYKPGAPPVLKKLSFTIESNEKIGIVGRTGAGKSSLTMALFRINELDAGRIVIDGVDISSMPLYSLRSRLSIIPQSPVLFKGSLRAYMDPFSEYSDAAIWSALEKVEMRTHVSALEHQLLFELSENGENFSVGERQLLCMARALLTQARVVVMDEATASIDFATEKKLQEMIARDFADATVLTIAHRLATVLASDRVMVLSDGEIVEFDTPQNLVQNHPHGVFYQLAKESGYLDRPL